MHKKWRKTGIIAWIDEDVDRIGMLVQPLEDAGFRVLKYRTVHEALASLEQIQEADLVLLDLILPTGREGERQIRYAGKTVLRQLRELHKTKPPVVVLSVVANEAILEKIDRLGVSVILRKPILPYSLKETVEQVLARRTPQP